MSVKLLTAKHVAQLISVNLAHQGILSLMEPASNVLSETAYIAPLPTCVILALLDTSFLVAAVFSA